MFMLTTTQRKIHTNALSLSPRREPLFVVVVVVPLLFVSIIQKLGVHYAYSDKMAPTYFVFSARTNI